jgi:hypothetical protein
MEQPSPMDHNGPSRRNVPKAHPQDVVERVAVAVEVEHRGEAARRIRRPPPCGPAATAQQASQQAAEPAARRGPPRPAALLLRHEAGDQHRQHRQHLLQQGRVEPGLRGGVLGHRPAHVLGAEDLAEHVVAAAHVGRLRGQHVVEQAAAAELPEQAAEAFEARGLRRGLLLEAAEDRRQQRLGAAGHLALADAELARHRLKSAHLLEDIGDLHVISPGSWLRCRPGPGGPGARRRCWRRGTRARYGSA